MAALHLELIALGLTALVHFAGAGVLIWALLDGEKVDWRSFLNPGDDDGGGGGRRRPEPFSPPGGGAPLPLPDAEQSAERFRDSGRLGDRKQRPPRRRAPEPAREPVRAPERV